MSDPDRCGSCGKPVVNRSGAGVYKRWVECPFCGWSDAELRETHKP